MAKDDYPVIVYQILSYLYNCLKKDVAVQTEWLLPQGKLFKINETYWRFVMYNLSTEGYIDGITLLKVWGEKYPLVEGLENTGITPAGIQYLTDNSFIKKATDLLKDTKSIIPFI